MVTRIGINGFGRIGRNASRIILGRKNMALAAVNSLSEVKSHAYLLKHDSAQGTFVKDVSVDGSVLHVDNADIQTFQVADPTQIPWEEANVDLVLECTGRVKNATDAAVHLRGTVKHVVVSAPVKDATPTVIMGVNHTTYAGQSVVSNSSCTTNCVTTVLKVLNDGLGVVRGNMTTIHAATDSQNLLDNSHKKEIRLRRSTLVNIIPASSGSATDVSKLFPHLAGLLPCRAIRVPVPTVSLIDLVVEVKKKTDAASVNSLFSHAADTSLCGILGVASEELVSGDYVGSGYSSVVDPFLTDVVDGTLVHVVAWYDNEWGYANSLVDLAQYISAHSQ